MTAQHSEILHYRGEKLPLCAEPLGPFLASSASPWKFVATSTALWRGYVGTWRIENERLYLVELSAHVEADDQKKDVGLDALFPDYPNGVFAHWYTGVLRCTSGALLQYVHGGFHSVYERDIFIPVQRGRVLGEHVVVNGEAAPDAPAGYQVAASYHF